VTFTVGALVVPALYVLYVLNVGEGAPFVSHVMAWGAAWASVVLLGLALGIQVARFVNRVGSPRVRRDRVNVPSRS
jgi:hypothetical protein